MLAGSRLVLIDDDSVLVTSLEGQLSRAGFLVFHSDTVMGGMVLVREKRPAVVIANVDLPFGQDLVTRLRDSDVPMILLTRPESRCVFASMDIEVLVKPFLFHTLLGHLDRLGVNGAHLEVRGVRLDLKNRVLTVSGVPVPVSRKEFELLCMLLRRPSRAYASRELAQVVWPDREVHLNSLTALVAGVRRKLARAGQPSFIRRVKGHGYGLDTHAGPP